jgi:hypothetical protein
LAEILGAGISHYPLLSYADEHMAGLLRAALNDPLLPAERRQQENWPAAMQEEYGHDGGAAGAKLHREALLESFRRVRADIERFRPDAIVVWGDDQYENFQEEIVPPFCVHAMGDLTVRPWKETRRRRHPNVWGEGADATRLVRGAPEIGKYLASGLLAADFDVAYSYRLRDVEAMPHAFMNTALYLDYEQSGKGFGIPTIPVSVNCYGRHTIAHQGQPRPLPKPGEVEEIDPPGPSPRRCYDLGRATARVLADSPWRIVLLASSSWSHAFLHDKAWRLFPDVEEDKRYYEALRTSSYDVWQSADGASLEASGQQEMLNWFCLVGAMAELGRTPTWSTFVETYAFNSDKCFVVYEQEGV